jgi:hypothetical protein
VTQPRGSRERAVRAKVVRRLSVLSLTGLTTFRRNDIVGEDNKTVIDCKVAARVVCVFSEQDAHMQNSTGTNNGTNTPNTADLRPHLPLLLPDLGQLWYRILVRSPHEYGGEEVRRPPMKPQGLDRMGGGVYDLTPSGKAS